MEKQIYTRHPAFRHFRAVKSEISRMMADHRLEEMETMQGYAILLRELGQYVERFTCSADEMKQIRVKAAGFIFGQLQRNSLVPDDAKWTKALLSVQTLCKEGSNIQALFLFPVLRPISATAIERLQQLMLVTARDADSSPTEQAMKW